MLSPEAIEEAGDLVGALYRQIESELLDHMARVAAQGAPLDQMTQTSINLLAQSQGPALRAIVEAHAGEVDGAVRAAVEDAIVSADLDDMARAGGGAAWPKQVAATVDGIARVLERDDLAMEAGAQQAYVEAMTEAVTRVNAGLDTPQRAMRRAVRQMEAKGASVVQYRDPVTGTPTMRTHADVAVMRHVRTQIAQDGARMTEERMDRLGVELVEVSSHSGARPEHAAWHGRCYSRHGDVTIDGTVYPDLAAATGLGTSKGLCGINCRHSYGPYRHGAPRAYDPDPKHPSGLSNDDVYALTQRQRALERRVRSAKRALSGARTAFEADGGIDARKEVHAAQERLRASQAALRGHIRDANAMSKTGEPVLYRRPDREWAGDMPRTAVPRGSGRGVDEFLALDSVRGSMRRSGVTKGAVKKAIGEQYGVEVFKAMTRAEQQQAYADVLSGVSLATAPARAARDARAADAQANVVRASAQRKHVKGTKEYEEKVAACVRSGYPAPSWIVGGLEEAQALVNRYAGKGVPMTDHKNEWRRREQCEADEVIGYVVARDGTETPTKWFTIHYADDHTHIVPTQMGE